MKAGGADKVLHFGARTTEKLEIHISFKDGVNQYAITLRATEADQLYPSDEVVYFWNKQQYPEEPYGKGLSPHGTEAGISAPQYPGIAEHVRSHLNRWRVYHFHDTSSHSPMKKTAMEVLN
jgi:hypothetical protein